MAKKIIIANWKMNPKTEKEAEKIFSDTQKAASKFAGVDVAVCPPDIFLKKLISRAIKVKVGAQDLSIFDGVGPYTGEVSADMLKMTGVKYVIVGHSSRRENGETNAEINKKVKNILKAGLVAVLCVGEKERNDSGEFMKVVDLQIREAFKGLSGEKKIKNIIVAYEPVWAISKGGSFKADNPDSVFGMSIFIKKTLGSIFGEDAAKKIPIIYGGSATAENAKDFLEKGGVRGLLVGGKSLSPKEFGEILKISDSAR